MPTVPNITPAIVSEQTSCKNFDFEEDNNDEKKEEPTLKIETILSKSLVKKITFCGEDNLV